MDKETDSSKSGSHRSDDERRRTRSVGREHHHSLRNSSRRSQNLRAIHGYLDPNMVEIFHFPRINHGKHWLV